MQMNTISLVVFKLARQPPEIIECGVGGGGERGGLAGNKVNVMLAINFLMLSNSFNRNNSNSTISRAVLMLHKC